MKTTSDNRFDPNIAAQILVAAAREQSLEHLFQWLVEHSAEALHVACVQFWLVDKGDLCASSPCLAECPDRSRCLHLVAAKGKSISGSVKKPRPFENHNARVPLGVGPIGEAVATGQERVFPDADEQPASLPGLEWLREERIRAYRIVPIRFKGETLGAGVFFGREDLPEEIGLWGRIFTDHLGAAIANARAFEKIRVTGKRLEETNQRLKRELVERKEAEQRLRESEQRYRRIVDTASEGIWELDEHYATTLVNRRMAEMLGYKPEEMAGRQFDEFLFEDDLADHQTRVAARRHGLAELFERRFRRKNGSAIWMQVSATPILDAQNRFMGSFAMMTDITERKQAEQEVTRLNFALDRVREAAFLTDDKGCFHYVNEAACSVLVPHFISSTTMPPFDS